MLVHLHTLEKKSDAKAADIILRCSIIRGLHSPLLSFVHFFPQLCLFFFFFPKCRLAREAVECTAVWHMYTAKRLTFAFVKASDLVRGVGSHLVSDPVPAHALGMER